MPLGQINTFDTSGDTSEKPDLIEAKEKHINRTKEDLNLLEQEITGEKSAEQAESSQNIEKLLHQEGVDIPRNSEGLLPQLRHDIDLVAKHILEQAYSTHPALQGGDVELSSLVTKQVKARMLKYFMVQASVGSFYGTETYEAVPGSGAIDATFSQKTTSGNRLPSHSIGDPRLSMNNLLTSFEFPLMAGQDINPDTPPTEEDVLQIIQGELDMNPLSDAHLEDRYTLNLEPEKSGMDNNLPNGLNQLYDQFNSYSTMRLPAIQEKMLTAAKESESRSEYYNKTGKKGVLNKVVAFVLDLFGNKSFKSLVESGTFQGVLEDYKRTSLKQEAKNCLKHFHQLASSSHDSLQIPAGSVPVLDLPFLSPGVNQPQAVNDALHLENTYQTVLNRYGHEHIHFNPAFCAGYAKAHGISKHDRNSVVRYSRNHGTREVRPTATRGQKEHLFVTFTQEQLKQLSHQSSSYRNEMQSPDHLTGYLFCEYVKGRYEYHRIFQEGSERTRRRS